MPPPFDEGQERGERHRIRDRIDDLRDPIPTLGQSAREQRHLSLGTARTLHVPVVETCGCRKVDRNVVTRHDRVSGSRSEDAYRCARNLLKTLRFGKRRRKTTLCVKAW